MLTQECFIPPAHAKCQEEKEHSFYWKGYLDARYGIAKQVGPYMFTGRAYQDGYAHGLDAAAEGVAMSCELPQIELESYLEEQAVEAIASDSSPAFKIGEFVFVGSEKGFIVASGEAFSVVRFARTKVERSIENSSIVVPKKLVPIRGEVKRDFYSVGDGVSEAYKLANADGYEKLKRYGANYRMFAAK